MTKWNVKTENQLNNLDPISNVIKKGFAAQIKCQLSELQST